MFPHPSPANPVHAILVPMTVLSRRCRASMALAVSALLLAGTTACGSTSNTATDPDQTPAAASSPEASGTPAGGGSSDSASPPVPGATARHTDPRHPAPPPPLTIESPEGGKQVSSTLSVSGTANSPEANVPWQIDSPTDGVLVSGFATAEGWLDKAYPWSTSIDVSALQPGTYTFTARVDDDSKKEGTTPPSATISFVKK